MILHLSTIPLPPLHLSYSTYCLPLRILVELLLSVSIVWFTQAHSYVRQQCYACTSNVSVRRMRLHM